MTTKQKIKREIRRILRQCRVLKPLPQANAMSEDEIMRDKAEFKRLNNDSRFVMKKENEYICRYDKYAENGDLGDGSYFIQDIWGARKVMENRPLVHYDVGSSVGGFIAHLLAQKQKIVLIDIRKMTNDFNTPFLNGGGIALKYAKLRHRVYPSGRDKFGKYRQ